MQLTESYDYLNNRSEFSKLKPSYFKVRFFYFQIYKDSQKGSLTASGDRSGRSSQGGSSLGTFPSELSTEEKTWLRRLLRTFKYRMPLK